MIRADERLTRPAPAEPARKRDESGPTRPDTAQPDTDELTRRLRRVDPDQAKKYGQRSGE